ncbi:hypothetical protein ACFXPM_37640 [Streptomyces sp. NPDC059095]|uniref:hypothetical protein n=1 Tax=Streptomyces sp. NPDC059095 TaxID=3346726 RepID=UPI0036C7B663
MRITIEGSSKEFERKLLDLFTEHRSELAVTVETDWNAERAVTFLSTLNPVARDFARRIVDAGGHLDAAVLRSEFEGGLRGPTVALTNALKRGFKRGWWAEGTEAPITVVYGGSLTDGWRQASAYELNADALNAFRQAFARLDAAPARLNWDGDAPSAPPLADWANHDTPRVLPHDAEPEPDGDS